MPEWAQLRAGAVARTGLERGFWYEVSSRGEGRLQVLGRDGNLVAVDEAQVRVVPEAPVTLTRVPMSEFHPVRPGEPSPAPEFYGICPKGHWIKDVPAGTELKVPCVRCRQSYPVEDEGQG